MWHFEYRSLAILWVYLKYACVVMLHLISFSHLEFARPRLIIYFALYKVKSVSCVVCWRKKELFSVASSFAMQLLGMLLCPDTQTATLLHLVESLFVLVLLPNFYVSPFPLLFYALGLLWRLTQNPAEVLTFPTRFIGLLSFHRGCFLSWSLAEIFGEEWAV